MSLAAWSLTAGVLLVLLAFLLSQLTRERWLAAVVFVIAAGLLALSVGLSRQFRDDLAQLEAGMLLYDAFYRWARDGFGEGHDWPQGRAH